MDRFIDYDEFGRYLSFETLKSNMDRFIVCGWIFYDVFAKL